MAHLVLPAQITGEVNGPSNRLSALADKEAGCLYPLIDFHGHARFADNLNRFGLSLLQCCNFSDVEARSVAADVLEKDTQAVDLQCLDPIQRSHQTRMVRRDRLLNQWQKARQCSLGRE